MAKEHEGYKPWNTAALRCRPPAHPTGQSCDRATVILSLVLRDPPPQPHTQFTFYFHPSPNTPVAGIQGSPSLGSLIGGSLQTGLRITAIWHKRGQERQWILLLGTSLAMSLVPTVMETQTGEVHLRFFSRASTNITEVKVRRVSLVSRRTGSSPGPICSLLIPFHGSPIPCPSRKLMWPGQPLLHLHGD